MYLKLGAGGGLLSVGQAVPAWAEGLNNLLRSSIEFDLGMLFISIESISILANDVEKCSPKLQHGAMQVSDWGRVDRRSPRYSSHSSHSGQLD